MGRLPHCINCLINLNSKVANIVANQIVALQSSYLLNEPFTFASSPLTLSLKMSKIFDAFNTSLGLQVGGAAVDIKCEFIDEKGIARELSISCGLNDDSYFICKEKKCPGKSRTFGSQFRQSRQALDAHAKMHWNHAEKERKRTEDKK